MRQGLLQDWKKNMDFDMMAHDSPSVTDMAEELYGKLLGNQVEID